MAKGTSALIEQRFHTGAVELNYVEGPDSGPDLVLLHGLATRWQIFRPLIRQLSKAWHVYAPDFRGHGQSGWTGPSYDVASLIADTIIFLERQVTTPVNLFGHSMGGWVGAGVAAQRPDLVRALIMADTALYPAQFPDDTTLQALFGIDRAAILDGTASTHAWPQSLKDLDPEVLVAYVKGRLTEGFDADALLPRVQCPVLLLQGNPAEGGFMTDEDVARGQELLGRVTLVHFPASGHWLHVQQPADVVHATSDFLTSL